MLLFCLASLTLSQTNWVPASSAVDREMTIRALRDEVDDLESRKGGYFWPVFWAGAGAGVAVLGAVLPANGSSSQTLKNALLIAGGIAGSASIIWLVARIARNLSISSDIAGKEDQLRALEAQRLQLGLSMFPGGGMLALTFAL
jgi:hypothetical protein